MQELTRSKLPLYTGNAYIYRKEDTRWNTPESWKIWVQYELWYKDRTQIGWILDEEKLRRHQLKCKADQLRKLGHYEFRKTPVPGVHKHKPFIQNKRSCGFRREKAANLDCPPQLVRGKRVEILYMGTSWAEEIRWEWRYNSERCWKRTKKRKQWMK